MGKTRYLVPYNLRRVRGEPPFAKCMRWDREAQQIEDEEENDEDRPNWDEEERTPYIVSYKVQKVFRISGRLGRELRQRGCTWQRPEPGSGRAVFHTSGGRRC